MKIVVKYLNITSAFWLAASLRRLEALISFIAESKYIFVDMNIIILYKTKLLKQLTISNFQVRCKICYQSVKNCITIFRHNFL